MGAPLWAIYFNLVHQLKSPIFVGNVFCVLNKIHFTDFKMSSKFNFHQRQLFQWAYNFRQCDF
jgi:hypothetical protein